jgi:hypothetical protein
VLFLKVDNSSLVSEALDLLSVSPYFQNLSMVFSYRETKQAGEAHRKKGILSRPSFLPEGMLFSEHVESLHIFLSDSFQDNQEWQS